MNALALAGVSLRRAVRDRTSLFFALLLPVAIILIIGATVGGQTKLRVGVVTQETGALEARLLDRLHASPVVKVLAYPDESAARTGLRRMEVDAVVVVPGDYDATLAAGKQVELPLLTEQANTGAYAAASAVSSIVAAEAARVQAAHFAANTTGTPYDAALPIATSLQQQSAPIPVEVTTAGGSDVLPLGFGYSAPTMLVLFVFINAVAGGGAIIQTRRLGIYDRALAAPIRVRTVVAGETLATLFFSLLQSALIVAIGSLVFGVSWGDPLAALALVVVWALVGTGAGVLSGTLFRTPEQAGSIGPTVGIAFGMLGGCMWPLAIVPSTLRAVGHVVPQSWAVDSWTELLSRGGHLADIAPRLGVLLGFAAALLLASVWRLRDRLAVS
jgi:linearmycin/streptolysin S transport system permease protein